MSSFRSWPWETASRCSMIASMCQPGTNGVDGSTISQACRTNSRRLRAANSASSSSRIPDLVSKGSKLANFVLCQLGKIWFGCNLDRAARCTGDFTIEIILVAKKVFGEEDRGCHVARVRQAKQIPADRNASLGFSTLHDLTKPL